MTDTLPPLWGSRLFGFKPNTGHDLVAELNATDPRLRAVVWIAAGISYAEFQLPLFVTHVHRLDSEQATLYAVPASRGIPVQVSPHQAMPSRAADCRVLHAPDPEKYGRELAARVNELVQYGPAESKYFVALYEDQQQNVTPHLHLQVPPVTIAGTPRRAVV